MRKTYITVLGVDLDRDEKVLDICKKIALSRHTYKYVASNLHMFSIICGMVNLYKLSPDDLKKRDWGAFAEGLVKTIMADKHIKIHHINNFLTGLVNSLKNG